MGLVVGSWVEFDGSVGYVEKVERAGAIIKVEFINGTTKKLASRDIKEMDPIMTAEDILELQHMAVLTDDKVWFDELGKLLKPQKS